MRRVRDHRGIDQASLFRFRLCGTCVLRFWWCLLCAFHDSLGLAWWRRQEVGWFEPGLIDDEQSQEAGDGIQNVTNITTVHRRPLWMSSNVAP